MSTKFFKTISSYNEDNQSDIFDLPPIDICSSKLDYIFYDQYFVGQNINKTTNYEDNQFYLISDSDSYSSFLYDTMKSSNINNLIDNKSDTEIYSKVKEKSRMKKKKSIDKISILHSPSDDDNIVTIGIYTKAERREKIRKYKEKLRNPVKKRILYKSRKIFADTRERVKGKFVKKSK